MYGTLGRRSSLLTTKNNLFSGVCEMDGCDTFSHILFPVKYTKSEKGVLILDENGVAKVFKMYVCPACYSKIFTSDFY